MAIIFVSYVVLSDAFLTSGKLNLVQSKQTDLRLASFSRKKLVRFLHKMSSSGGDDLMKKFEEERKIREEMDEIFKKAQNDLREQAKLELDSLKSEAEEIQQRREEEWARL